MPRSNPRARAALVLGATIVLALSPRAARAHNSAIHVAMTETAYGVIRAAEHYRTGKPVPEPLIPIFTELAKDPAMLELLDVMTKAAPKLRALPSGLPWPFQWSCADDAFAKKTGSAKVDWGIGSAQLVNVPLGELKYAVGTDYQVGSDCGMAVDWNPGLVWKDLLAGADGQADIDSGDHTGVTLGFWSIGPDNAMDDIHMMVRPSNMYTAGYLKKWIEDAAGGAAGTVWVPTKCAVKCAAAVLTFGLVGDCKKCVKEAVDEAKSGTHDVVTEIDGLLPSHGDVTNSQFTGIPHHINPPGPKPWGGVWAVPATSYDDQWGLLVDRAGPDSLPDPIEMVTMAFSDYEGLTFSADKSEAIVNYPMTSVKDGHPLSVQRTKQDWEYLSWPHVAMTPVDNLGMFGWMQAEGYAQVGAFQAGVAPDKTKVAFRLGWALHAIGDATVPMHATGTFGWGHRPYEDVMQNKRSPLFRRDSAALTARMVQVVLTRALAFRKQVHAWRDAHPGVHDVPLRDLVSGVSQKTMARLETSTFEVFHPTASTRYLVDKDANLYYEDGPLDLYQDLVDEGTGASVAFLTSAMELFP